MKKPPLGEVFLDTTQGTCQSKGRNCLFLTEEQAAPQEHSEHIFLRIP